MTERATIIDVLREISKDKRMLNHADYWALICGEAADLLESEKNEREPHVMTLEEVENAINTVAWEDEEDIVGNDRAHYVLIESYSRKAKKIWIHFFWHKICGGRRL